MSEDIIDETPGLLLVKFDLTKDNEYRLYGGIRATLVFHPRWGLPKNEELYQLCEELQPMMFTQLWRKWEPINIPVSTKQIDVIGFQKLTFLNGEGYDIAFPFIEKAEFNHQNQTFTRCHSQTSSSWFSSLTPSYSDNNVPVCPALSTLRVSTQNTAQISYAAILR